MSSNVQVFADIRNRDFRSAYAWSIVRIQFGLQLSATRQARGLTVEQLAHKAKIHPRVIRRIEGLEKSIDNIRIRTLEKIASALDVALVVRFAPYSEVIKQDLVESVPAFGEE